MNMEKKKFNTVGSTKVSKLFSVSLLGRGSGFVYPRSRKPELGSFYVVAATVEEAIEKARSAYEDFRHGTDDGKDADGLVTLHTKQSDPGFFEVESVTLTTEFLVL
jgi:hypothetical protein